MHELARRLPSARVFAWLLAAAVVAVVSGLIPPFQSPDEFDHVKRAYLFAKGQILLVSPPPDELDAKVREQLHSGNIALAGGGVDTGLLRYFDVFRPLPTQAHQKLSQEETLAAKAIRWSGERGFSPAPGTAYYFPAIYAPQALALLAGEALGWGVDASYQLARFFVLAFSAAVMAAAFAVFPVNALTIALLILPISVFQLASASMDAFSTAVTVLCISLFMRGCIRRYAFPAWMAYALAACVVLLATSRMHLLPLLAMPLVVWQVRRQRALLWQFAAVTAFSLGWLLLSIKGSYIHRGVAGLSTSQIIGYYLSHPVDLVAAILRTLADPEKAEFYAKSLIGMLGWLDTRFGDRFYAVALVTLGVTAVFSWAPKTPADERLPRMALLAGAVLSIALMFCALLVTWNPLPTKIIEGVQGRYFIPPLMMLGYALAGSNGLGGHAWNRFGVLPVLLLAAMTAWTMPKLLVTRYFMTTTPQTYKQRPSAPLGEVPALRIAMTQRHQATALGLKRVGIQFGTWARRNAGEAELRLQGPGGETAAQRFALADLVDNAYRYFELDGKRYAGGEIRALSGGGVSAWESDNGEGGFVTCVVYEYVDGRRSFTPGCPLP